MVKKTTSTKRSTTKKSSQKTVDFHPMRMTVAVSAMAAASLLLLGVLVSL